MSIDDISWVDGIFVKIPSSKVHAKFEYDAEAGNDKGTDGDIGQELLEPGLLCRLLLW